MPPRRIHLADSDLSYTFTCPSCQKSFSILLERIPPVQARFGCPHCKQPMDFPSREEARTGARREPRAAAASAGSAPARAPAAREAPHALSLEEGSPVSENARFRVDKPGFESDIFDRRAMRNLIRSGEVDEGDRVRMDEGGPVRAAELPFLKSLFALRKSSRISPPTGCRTHTEKVAHFRCKDSGRPLCEACSPEKKRSA